MAAISWLSVKLEISSPIEIIKPPISRMPIQFPKNNVQSGVTRKATIIANTINLKQGQRITNSAAKYLPSTIPVRLMGR